MEQIWNWLLPASEDALLRGRAGLILIACLALAAACLALIATWFISRDLQKETVLAAGVGFALLAGIGALARSGQVTLAAWLLVGLLAGVITLDVFYFGVASLGASAHIIPVLVASLSLGFWPGLAVAALVSGTIWVAAWGEVKGWHAPRLGADVSHLKFNAPALTVIFMFIALLVGYWTGYVNTTLRLR